MQEDGRERAGAGAEGASHRQRGRGFVGRLWGRTCQSSDNPLTGRCDPPTGVDVGKRLWMGHKGGSGQRRRGCGAERGAGCVGARRFVLFLGRVYYPVLNRFSCGNALWDRPLLWVFLRFAGLTRTTRPETTH